MAILHDGLHGGFRGKAGGLVGRKIRGKYVVSALPHASKPEAVLRVQQQKFRLAFNCLKKIRVLLNVGLAYDARRSPMSLAMHFNLPVLVMAQEEGFEIVYANLVLSRGRQAVLNSASASLDGAGAAVFSWFAAQPDVYCRDDDKCCFLVYNATRQEPLVAYMAGLRSDLLYKMDLPDSFAGNVLHAYCFTVSADGRYAGDGVYLGLLS